MARTFLTAVDLAKNELQNARVQNLSTAPSSPVTGQLYYDTDDNILYWWNGSAWTSAVGGSVSFGSITAETTFGGSSSDGVAATAARSDHTHGNPTHDAAAHSAIKISDLTAPNASVSFGSQKITSLADGTVATDAATYGQLLAAVNGFDWKASVRVATAAAGTLATSFENGDTVDGVTLVTGDRILIKDQASGAENGIYVVAASGAPTRATDADASAEVTGGLTVFVNEGTANSNTVWTLTTNDAITLGSTALVFAQTAGPGDTIAGTGLSRSGATLSIATGYQARLYAADIGDGSTTSITVTHSLGTRDVIVQVYDNTTPWQQVEVDVRHTSTSALTLVFAVAPTSNQYRVNVITVV